MKKPVLKYLFIIVFTSIYFAYANAEVILEGTQPTYSGKEIAFYTFTDPFTTTDSLIGSCRVDSNGYFNLTLSVSDTMLLFSYLGIYKGYIYVVPNSHYVINFPDWQEKSTADKLNPFFEPVEFYFNVENDDGKQFNKLFQRFDSVYFELVKKYLNPLKPLKKSIIDSVQWALQQYIPSESPNFFKNYAWYKFGFFQYLTWHKRAKSLSRTFFESKPILYNNVAYFDLFNAVYDKYFYFYGQTSEGKIIFDIINNSKSYYQLNQLFNKDIVLQNESFRELVILKNIYSEFYSSNFSRSGLLNILDSLIVSTNNERHKSFGKLIRHKITRLMPDNYPPDFELYDKDNRLVKLSDFKGMYVYLNFCSCISYACMKEFDLLGRVAEKFAKKLIILTISTDENKSDMMRYANNGHINWIFLHYGNQPDVIKNYDVRAYPVYFLIGPDGKLIFSPARSPAEYFELDLFKVMKARGDL